MEFTSPLSSSSRSCTYPPVSGTKSITQFFSYKKQQEGKCTSSELPMSNHSQDCKKVINTDSNSEESRVGINSRICQTIDKDRTKISDNLVKGQSHKPDQCRDMEFVSYVENEKSDCKVGFHSTHSSSTISSSNSKIGHVSDTSSFEEELEKQKFAENVDADINSLKPNVLSPPREAVFTDEDLVSL